MERLTEKLADGRNVLKENYAYVTNPKHGSFIEGKAVDKLAEYEQAEEDGLLKRIPCRVGDEFWVMAYKSDVITHVKCSGYLIQEDIPNGIKHGYIWIDSIDNPKDYWKLDFEDFKNQCFATKAEAEQALAKMKGV